MLPSLPNLRAVEYPCGALDSVRTTTLGARKPLGPAAVASRQFILGAFKDLPSRCTAVEVLDFSSDRPYDDRVQELALFGSPESVRTLSVCLRDGRPDSRGQSLLDFLGLFAGLETLSITSVGGYHVEMHLPESLWAGSVPLGTLRSLTLGAVGDTGAFAFVSRSEPNLEKLDATVYCDSSKSLDEDVPVLAFLALRRLRLASLSPCGELLKLFDLGAIRSLELYVNEAMEGSLDCDKLIPESVVLPRGLRLHISTHCLPTLDNARVSLPRRRRRPHAGRRHAPRCLCTAGRTRGHARVVGAEPPRAHERRAGGSPLGGRASRRLVGGGRRRGLGRARGGGEAGRRAQVHRRIVRAPKGPGGGQGAAARRVVVHLVR